MSPSIHDFNMCNIMQFWRHNQENTFTWAVTYKNNSLLEKPPTPHPTPYQSFQVLGAARSEDSLSLYLSLYMGYLYIYIYISHTKTLISEAILVSMGEDNPGDSTKYHKALFLWV